MKSLRTSIMFGVGMAILVIVNPSLSFAQNAAFDPLESKTYSIINSPLKQFKSGVSSNDIVCTNGFTLVTKSEDRTPACVTQKTSYELLSRGWAILVGSTTISDVTVNGTTYHIPYVLRGHGNKMLEMDANTTMGYLVMHVDSTADKGEITVIIPKALLDPQNHDFVVLVDGAEVKYTEVVTQTTNTLTIPFGFGAKEIEVIISRLV